MSAYRWGWEPIPNISPTRPLTDAERKSATAELLSEEPDRPALRAIGIALLAHGEAVMLDAERLFAVAVATEWMRQWERERAATIADSVGADYPEGIWPRPDGNTTSRDCFTAAGCRLAARRIAEGIRKSDDP